jgi:hypothetical protein
VAFKDCDWLGLEIRAKTQERLRGKLGGMHARIEFLFHARFSIRANALFPMFLP